MVISRAQEIASHLQHNDVSLAVRRMLDLSLESNDKSLMRETINWSKKIHSETGENNYPQEYIAEAIALLIKPKRSAITFPMNPNNW